MFQVEWLKSALDDLARIWVNADSMLRGFITTASDQIDARLTRDPFKESSVLKTDLRICFVIPLAISFRLEADGKTISVLHAWLMLPQNGNIAP